MENTTDVGQGSQKFVWIGIIAVVAVLLTALYYVSFQEDLAGQAGEVLGTCTEGRYYLTDTNSDGYYDTLKLCTSGTLGSCTGAVCNTIKAVTIATDGVNVNVDSGAVQITKESPKTYQWGVGTRHTLSALPGMEGVFTQWSDGNAQPNREIVVTSDATYTAQMTTTATCTPKTDAQLCSDAGKVCGSYTTTDNCGAPRTVTSCGTCTTGTCTNNVCVATPTFPAEFTLVNKENNNCVFQGTTLAVTLACSATGNKVWTYDATTNALKLKANGQCLYSAGDTLGGQVWTGACDGSAKQQWKYNPVTQEFTMLTSGGCLSFQHYDVPVMDGLVLALCDGSPRQKWAVVSPPTAAAVCGNGVIDTGEQCDGTAVASGLSLTCPAGYTGSKSCTSCQIVDSCVAPPTTVRLYADIILTGALYPAPTNQIAECIGVTATATCGGIPTVLSASPSGSDYSFSAITSSLQVPIKRLILKDPAGTIVTDYVCPSGSTNCNFAFRIFGSEYGYAAYSLEAKT